MIRPRLGLALAGLELERLGLSGVRDAVAWARAQGVRGVQIDAAAAETRPRALDRSGRRDLAALLRRSEIEFCGVDLWVPAEHFADPAQSDRAAAAVLAAIDLTSELTALCGGRGTALCVSLPGPGKKEGTVGPVAATGVVVALADRAARAGVRLADFGDAAAGASEANASLGVGIDPAAIISRGGDPAREAVMAGARLGGARFTDVARSGGRVAPGGRGGRLDARSYTVALVTAGFAGAAIADLRGVAEQAEGLRLAVEAWEAGPG